MTLCLRKHLHYPCIYNCLVKSGQLIVIHRLDKFSSRCKITEGTLQLVIFFNFILESGSLVFEQ